MCTRAIDYTFKESETGKKKWAETDGLEEDAPFCVGCVGRCLSVQDLENRPSESNDAEYEEVDPTKLFMESVAEKDDKCEKEDGDVDYELGYCYCFSCCHFVRIQDLVEIVSCDSVCVLKVVCVEKFELVLVFATGIGLNKCQGKEKCLAWKKL